MTLEKLIRTCGESELIDDYVPPADALTHIRSLLQEANDRLTRSPQGKETISEESLSDEYHRSPHKVKAFLQAIRETGSADMLVVAWRILQGAKVAGISLCYSLENEFSLRIQLISPDENATEEYQSTNINDAAIFRHLGILKMQERPVFDGFYALN